MTTQPREPSGTSGAGRFTTQGHKESTVTLDGADSPSPQSYDWTGESDDVRPEVGSATPWGPAEVAEETAPGLSVVFSSAGGGLRLSRARNAAVDEAWRQDGGWYSEDNEWAAVGVAFPEHPPTPFRYRTDEYATVATSVAGRFLPPRPADNRSILARFHAANPFRGTSKSGA